MSKGPRWPLVAAAFHAQRLVPLLEPIVTRIAIAGSIRRQRPDVGDIDLVVEIAADNPWGGRQLEQALGLEGWAVTKAGEKIMSFRDERAERPPIDVYIATPETWGMTLLVRTGSAAHNYWLAQVVAKAQLPRRHFAVSRGITDSADRVIAGATEADVFAALKLPYIEPARRERPEYEELVARE